MHQPTRFGDHLLLKKLGEDPFGEIYRAGRVVDQKVGDLELLRIFGGATRSKEILRAFEKERRIAGGPGIVQASERGAVEGVAFLAYPWASGRDLSTLARQANEGFSSLETRIAVLVAERIAKGLAVAHQSEEPDRRNHHGLLVPHLIWVTSEGETYLTGSEIAGVMLERVRSGAFGPDVQRYLSPEVRSGSPPEPADDVYSLGAILFELLTGEKVPEDASSRLPTVLASAQMIEDSAPLPAGLSTLLERSLASRAERTARADAWHRQLSGWMADSGLRATNFDLAFFMSDLFRTDLRKENEEIEAEKRIDLSRKPAAAAAAAPAAPASPAVAAPAAAEYYDVDADAPARKSPVPLLAGLAAVAALAIGGWFFFGRSEPAPEPAAAPPPPTGPTAQAIDLEAAAAELDKLLEERTESVSSKISEEYEQQIALLQSQLEAARVAEEEALEAARQAPVEPTPEQPAPRASTVSPAPAGAEAAAAEPDRPAPTPATGGGTAPEPEPSAPTPPPPAAPAPPPPVRPTPTPDRAAPATTPAQAEIVPPERLTLPAPVYPEPARRAGRQATVIVKVLVGPDGQVRDAQLASTREVGYGFDQAAVRAARGATFKPATRDGQPIEMWTTVVLSFKLE